MAEMSSSKMNNLNQTSMYPEGSELKKQVSSRQQRGFMWQISFIIATMVGIVALVALLYNIINSSFGYVAVQNTTDPEAVVMTMHENKILNATNVNSSENDIQLANRTASSPYAVAFFGYSYYQRKTDKLRVLTIDGMNPSVESVESGEYFMARPLYFYASESAIHEKPQVQNFVRYYLDNVNNVISDVGYFATSDEVIANSLAQLDAFDAAGAEATDESILISGSSTVFPLSREIIKQYEDSGASAEIELSSTGSKAGIAQFCNSGSIDIANASRAMNRAEQEICRKSRITPLEFRVGTDAIAVVVSQKNEFVDELTLDELRTLFTTAVNWSDVRVGWPDETHRALCAKYR